MLYRFQKNNHPFFAQWLAYIDKRLFWWLKIKV